MAADTTNAAKKKNKGGSEPEEDTEKKETKGANATPYAQGRDVAKTALSKEQILALHRKKAEAKESITSDVVGYWNSDGEFPITGIPMLGVIAIDSSIDKTKPSLLMKWRVTVPTEVIDAQDNTDICNEGDLIGIWFKPGMRDVRDYGGVEVTMARDPKRDKDVKKGNDMKGFALYADGMGQALRISEDRREKSKGKDTPFDVQQAAPESARAPRNAPPVYADGERLPF